MFRTVVIGVDGRSGGRDAIALGRRLAGQGAAITLVHVYPGNFAVIPSILVGDETEEQRSFRVVNIARRASGLDAKIASIGAPSVGAGLHQLAEERSADLLVVGSSARGLAGRVLSGDDTRAALNGAHCAVAIAPRDYARDEHSFTRIGVAYDGSPESELALSVARDLAAPTTTEVEALNVVHVPLLAARTPAWAGVMPDLVETANEQMAKLPGVHGSAVMGPVLPVLVSLGQRVDLLVVGSRGYGPLQRLVLGSTSTYLQRHAPCPLLVVPRGTSPAPPRETQRRIDISAAAVVS